MAHLEKKLSDLEERLTKAKRELEIVGEQLSFQVDVEEDAKQRMLVADTPIADREYRVARDDLERLRRYYEERRAEITSLEGEQDVTFDRLMGRVIRGSA